MGRIAVRKLTVKKSLTFGGLVLSIVFISGCHLMSHYDDDEVRTYLDNSYPSMNYRLEAQGGHTWLLTFDQYPDMPFVVNEILHTSAPVVPQVDRILSTSIPETTVFPLLRDYVTAYEYAYVSYSRSSGYVEGEIPLDSIENGDVQAFFNRIDQFCKAYAKTYPAFKDHIYLRMIVDPGQGESAPNEYRRVFRLSQY